MKTLVIILFSSFLATSFVQADALSMSSSSIQSWASGVHSISYGSDVSEEFMTPSEALGQAEGGSFSIVCLGRGGQITLTFPNGISNGSGDDFAVFENGFEQSDGDFLELAWVEISTDGEHFVRLLNFTSNTTPISGFGGMNGDELYGLASMYTRGYGTSFDLNVLQLVYTAVSEGSPTGFSEEYSQHLLNNFHWLDLNNIQYVRLIDIVGAGTAYDSYGNTIYDPYPTIVSAGFDLDGIAVLNESSTTITPLNTFLNWATDNHLSGDPSTDTDGDGATDLEEYLLGTDPNDVSDQPSWSITPTSAAIELSYPYIEDTYGTVSMTSSSNLNDWAPATPTSVVTNGAWVTAQLPIKDTNEFIRLNFEENE